MANRCLRCTGHALSPAQPGCPGIEQSHTIVLGSRTKSDVLNVAHLAKGGGISWLAQSQACLVMSAMGQASNRGRG